MKPKTMMRFFAVLVFSIAPLSFGFATPTSSIDFIPAPPDAVDCSGGGHDPGGNVGCYHLQ